jgi:flavin-dependent dehydrogenase
MDYDLIVVGGGAGGLMTAYEAAKAGLQVVVIEKKEHLNKNIRFNSSILHSYPGINGEWISLRKGDGTTQLHFHRLNFSVPYTGSYVEFYDSYSISNAGYRFHLSNKSEPLGIFFDMDAILSDLLLRAANQGVSFIAGALGIAAENIPSGARVLVKRKNKQFWLSAKKVVSAEGLISRIAEGLGLNKKRKYYGKSIMKAYRVEGVESPFPPSYVTFSGYNYNPVTGRGVSIGRDASAPGCYFVSAGGLAPGGRRVDNIDYLTTKSPIASWFKHARIGNALACAVTVFSPLEDPICGNILMLGETVGYAETLVHGAMACGYVAARSITQELEGKQGFEEYRRYWNDSFEWLKGDKYRAAYIKNIFFYRYFNQEEVDELFKLVDGQTFYGKMNPYTNSDRICTVFLEQPGLKPHLAEKLKAFQGMTREEIAGYYNRLGKKLGTTRYENRETDEPEKKRT